MGLSLRQQRDRASLYWLFGLFVLLPLTAVFGHRGVAPWLLLAALPAFARGDFWQSAFGQLFDRPELRDPFFAAFLSILTFCVWIFVSGFWSPQQRPGLVLNVLAPVLVGGSVVWFALNLSRIWAFRLSYIYAISIAAGVAVLAFEGITGGALRSALPPAEPAARDLTALGRGVTALTPALFPAAAIAAMYGRPLLGLSVIGVGLIAAGSLTIAANALAILVGCFAGFAAMQAPRSTIRGLAALAILLLVSAPAAMLLPVDVIFSKSEAPASWLHRIAVWQSVGARIPEGLPFGFGADFARTWKETTAMIDVPGAPVPLELMPTHPHNIFLQVWLELGLPGVLALALSFYFGAQSLLRHALPRSVVIGASGGVAAVLVSFMIEGSIWQVWRLAAIALAAMGVALSYSLYRIRVS